MAVVKKPLALNLFGAPRVLPQEEDHRLMLRVAQGDDAAFRRLYDRYKAPVRSYIHSLVRTASVADEIAQEVFLRVYRSRDRYTADAKFSTWLWTIARNLSFDQLRKKSEILQDETSPAALEPESPDPTAEALLVERATQQGIQICLDELTPAQSQAVALRIHAELSYEQIADTLQVSLPAVKNHLHRAKAALIDCLKRGGHRG
jgi:RNA polymerase sigma-70 factor (ECF subfamily)